ncbi:MAG TPA: alkaline phosphatase D family protein [Streptosporangiaceae bacterium]|jgi:hypothetical protein
MAELVLGPLLRCTEATSAAIWVETDAPCEVRVLGAAARTFTVHGHHYALVDVDGLEPGTSTPYTVELDGERVWPEPGSAFPPSRVRTPAPDATVRVVFGSCRVSGPHETADNVTHGVDVLRAYALRAAAGDADPWPTVLLMAGDQVYADEPSEQMRAFIRDRRDVAEPPGEEIADFAEYAHLYRLAFGDPACRWLLSTVPSLMIFDDHDIRDDWNTSRAWREEITARPWWRARITGGLGAYWIYQHIGNLPRAERDTDELLAKLRAADGDGGDLLDAFAWRADQENDSNRWSYRHDFGGTRLVVVDSRCGRVLTPGKRRMLAGSESAWLDDQCRGDVDHLLIATSLPFLLPAGLYDLEAWNEAVCDGVWGRRAAAFGERIRQAYDLEHWAAFRTSCDMLTASITEVARGERGRPPASIVFLSGDVHHSYLNKVTSPPLPTPIYQAVCSPIRNPMTGMLRLANIVATFGVAQVAGRVLARLAGIRRPGLRWKLDRRPWFSNSLSTLDIDHRTATIRWEAATVNVAEPQLATVATVDLTGRPPA